MLRMLKISQWDGSFEHQKHMYKLMGKDIITILCSDMPLSRHVEYKHGWKYEFPKSWTSDIQIFKLLDAYKNE